MRSSATNDEYSYVRRMTDAGLVTSDDPAAPPTPDHRDLRLHSVLTASRIWQHTSPPPRTNKEGPLRYRSAFRLTDPSSAACLPLPESSSGVHQTFPERQHKFSPSSNVSIGAALDTWVISPSANIPRAAKPGLLAGQVCPRHKPQRQARPSIECIKRRPWTRCP